MNPAMFDQVTYGNLGHRSYMSVLYIFDGTYDFDDLIQNADKEDAQGYDFEKIYNEISAAGITTVAQIAFESNIHAVKLNENTVKFPLSESVYEIEKLSENTATWFMFIPTNNSFSESVMQTKALTASQIFVGSVGDIGSGKDMELPGAAFAVDKDYKATDLEFKLV